MSYFINWKSYFEDKQVKEYNLKSTKAVILYNTSNLNIPGEYQINYMNKYIGELVMMYYIWKHNLKSDYICISQYRKDFTNINFDKLKDNYIQCWGYWEEPYFNNEKIPFKKLFKDSYHLDPDDFWKNKFNEYLNIQNIYDKSVIYNIINCENYTHMYTLVFAMKWEIFCKLCEFIFGFLEYVFPNNGWLNIENIKQLQLEKFNIYKNIYGDPGDNWNMIRNDRYIVFVIERILMVCLSSMHKLFQGDLYINKNIITESNYFVDIGEFYKRNQRTNVKSIYCKVSDDKFNETYEFFNKYEYVFPNLKIIHDYDNINDNLIHLNIDEQIDIDDPNQLNNMFIGEIKKYINKIKYE